MTPDEIKALVGATIEGQGNQVDLGSKLADILGGIIDLVAGLEGSVGDLSSLETDHKSDLVNAVNELFDVTETQAMVVSLSKSSAELKSIYEACLSHIHLAKNIVFFNADDELYYPVNAYNFHEDALWLNTIFSDNGTLRSVTVSIASNGSISVV